MAQPTKFVPSYDFSDFQAANPNDPLPAAQVDAQLALLKTTTDETIDNLGLIQKDDGTLANLSVGNDQLSLEARRIMNGWTPKGPWATETKYDVKDVVSNGGVSYVCVTKHTSGTFSTDLAADKWMAITDVPEDVEVTPTGGTADTLADLLGAVDRTVATIAALKALTAAVSALKGSMYVRGYTSAGDGGGGWFRWDAASETADNGGTVIALDAGGTGRWERIVTGPRCPDWYGAVGDGAADDTTAVQAALDGGADVRLTSGRTYLVTALTLNAGQILSGRGATFKQKASTTGDLVTASAADITIRDVVIDGNKANQTNDNFGVRSVSATRLSLLNCYIKDCKAGSVKATSATDLQIEGCRFENGGDLTSTSRNEVGIASSQDVRVIGNRFNGSATTGGDNVGLLIDTSGGEAVVQGNVFENYESESIQVVRYDAGAEDTSASRIKRVSIVGNYINGTTEKSIVGIHVGENCQEVVVSGNVIYDCVDGVKVGQWVRNVAVADNVCSLGTTGITVLGASYGQVAVTGNVCTDNSGNGIILSGAAADPIEGIVVSSNVCANNNTGGTASIGGIKIDADIQHGVIANNVCTDTQAVKTQGYGLVVGAKTFTNLTLIGNVLTGNATASALVSASRYSFYSIANDEGASPQLYAATFSYTVATGAGAIAWTAPNANFDSKRYRIVLEPTNPGGTAGEAGWVAVSFGRSAGGRDVVGLYNPTANSAQGDGYVFLEGAV